MSYVVDFNDVSTTGLEASPVAPALAGLRANEARHFKNKYDHDFTVQPASDAKETVDWVHRILKEQRLTAQQDMGLVGARGSRLGQSADPRLPRDGRRSPGARSTSS